MVGESAVDVDVMLLLRVDVDVRILQHFPGHYPCQKSSGFDPPDRETKGLLREKEAAARVQYYLIVGDLPPPFVARRSSGEALKCHNRENAFVTAQSDHSHCPRGPESTVARTLARPLVAWGWVKSRVFGDFHVEWEWLGLK